MMLRNLLLGTVLIVSGQAQAAINVFACEPEWAALAAELGGRQLEIYSATTARQDPHHIQARPALIAKARQAELLICTGAELETGWLPLLLRKAGNARIQPGQPGHFVASDFVDLLEKPEAADRSHGDIHASGNPHIHTDPANILAIAGQLQQRLIQIDPDNAEVYTQRYKLFASEWQQAVDNWKERTSVLNGVPVVVHHDYWSYLLHWSGLVKVATLEPLPGISPSTSHLARLRQELEIQHPRMIIHTNYMNDRPVLWLAEQTGLPVVTLPATVDYQAGESLHHWFENLIDLLLGDVQ